MEETVTISWASLETLLVPQLTEVEVLHESVAHTVLEASAVAVMLAGPRFRPAIVSEDAPLTGMFGHAYEPKGASNVSRLLLVPIMLPAVSTIVNPKPEPAEGAHLNIVADVQETETQELTSSLPDGVPSATAKWRPEIEVKADPDCAKFSRMAMEPTGASNENWSVVVPASEPTVKIGLTKDRSDWTKPEKH